MTKVLLLLIILSVTSHAQEIQSEISTSSKIEENDQEKNNFSMRYNLSSGYFYSRRICAKIAAGLSYTKTELFNTIKLLLSLDKQQTYTNNDT